MPVDALRGADEAFLTSTIREVQPIAAVDGHGFPRARPVTSRLADRVHRPRRPRSRPLSPPLGRWHHVGRAVTTSPAVARSSPSATTR